MRVLIADDQRTFGTALADMVCWCGHHVVAVVGSGIEAIHAYTLHKPDLVLMDYRMPKLNGGTACRHILAKDPAARIILVSAWSPLDAADESGAIFFLPKPVELDRLNTVLLTVEQTIPPHDLSAASELPTPSSSLPFPISDLAVDSVLPAPCAELPCSVLPAPGFDIFAPSSELPAPCFSPAPDIFPQSEEALPPVAAAPVAKKNANKARRRPQRTS